MERRKAGRHGGRLPADVESKKYEDCSVAADNSEQTGEAEFQDGYIPKGAIPRRGAGRVA